jgi:hypothetical protein
MKRITTVVLLFAAAVCAPAATEEKSGKTATTPQAATVPPKAVTIPKDAVKNENGTYSYTDKQGKKWLYSNSPFGVIRTAVPETEATTHPPANKVTGDTKAIDKGDTVQFESPSPFGKVTWERKKSELTDDERHILDSQDKSQTAKPDAK